MASVRAQGAAPDRAGVASGRAGAGPDRAAAARFLALRERVAMDVRAGRPVVAQAHVALCSNRVIRCGERGRGDGDDLARNLYWSTAGGMRGWMERRGSGWRARALGPGALDDVRRARPDVLDVRVWERSLGQRGATAVLVAFAWRGDAIDRALDAYLGDLGGAAPTHLVLADGRPIAIGTGAHVVGFVGHNRLMDRPDRTPEAIAALMAGGGALRGALMMACWSQAYLGPALAHSAHVPLLLTRDYVFAGSMAFEAAFVALARGGSLADIRAGAARAYAEAERKPLARVDAAFTNPSHRAWSR